MRFPLIEFLAVFVLLFILWMSIPLGLMTVCMFYFMAAA